MKGMKLRTSRYAAGPLIVASGLVPVRTSLGGPRFKIPYRIEGVCRLLMPRRDMLGLPIEEYESLYVEILEGHGLDAIRQDFRTISNENGGRGLVLLCFEDLNKSDNWCHRRMFADWWTEQTGEPVPELAAPGSQTSFC